ncbi:hypothetical protein ACB092_01G131100 [Castanea dentata]
MDGGTGWTSQWWVANAVSRSLSRTQPYRYYSLSVSHHLHFRGILKNVCSGDCVVAFLREEIFEVKMGIENHTNHLYCVIYGALPPETRRRYNGDKIVPVLASQVKQIAGRAGHRGSHYLDGLAMTLHFEDLDFLMSKVGIFPFFEQVELFDGQLPNVVILSLEDCFNFSYTPINIRDPKAMYHLLRFASANCHNVPVNIVMGLPKGPARNGAELLDLETKHQLVQSLTKANWKLESRLAGKLKPQKKADGYERPRSLIRLYENFQRFQSLES